MSMNLNPSLLTLQELHRKRVQHLQDKIAELEAEVKHLKEELEDKDDQIFEMSTSLAGEDL
jgi:uncharacterized small protein (DUF1192 family)